MTHKRGHNPMAGRKQRMLSGRGSRQRRNFRPSGRGFGRRLGTRTRGAFKLFTKTSLSPSQSAARATGPSVKPTFFKRLRRENLLRRGIDPFFG